jgi:hypothetical protein
MLPSSNEAPYVHLLVGIYDYQVSNNFALPNIMFNASKKELLSWDKFVELPLRVCIVSWNEGYN